jgi:hypothetical protein
MGRSINFSGEERQFREHIGIGPSVIGSGQCRFNNSAFFAVT